MRESPRGERTTTKRNLISSTLSTLSITCLVAALAFIIIMINDNITNAFGFMQNYGMMGEAAVLIATIITAFCLALASDNIYEGE